MDTGNYMASQMDDLITNGMRQYEELIEEMDSLENKLIELQEHIQEIETKSYLQEKEREEFELLGRINQLKWILNIPDTFVKE